MAQQKQGGHKDHRGTHSGGRDIAPPDAVLNERVRLDVWLWAARFYKTRALSQAAIEQGKVRIGDLRPKPARLLQVGDQLQVRTLSGRFDIVVRDLATQRGPAATARLLYTETPESVAARAAALAQTPYDRDPAAVIGGRPTKRDRRVLDRWGEHAGGEGWEA